MTRPSPNKSFLNVSFTNIREIGFHKTQVGLPTSSMGTSAAPNLGPIARPLAAAGGGKSGFPRAPVELVPICIHLHWEKRKLFVEDDVKKPCFDDVD